MAGSCCQAFEKHIGITCEQHGDRCPDRLVIESSFDGRLLLAATNAEYDFEFCPWCGVRVQDHIADTDPGHRRLS